MAKKIEKTNAARLLDKAGISYRLIPYEFDENDLAAHHVAESLGQDIAKVFKTLVLRGDRTGHIVCVIPGDCEVNLKSLAKVSGNKKVEMIPMKDLLAVTGYIRGGCSPVGMKKRFPTYKIILNFVINQCWEQSVCIKAKLASATVLGNFLVLEYQYSPHGTKRNIQQRVNRRISQIEKRNILLSGQCIRQPKHLPVGHQRIEKRFDNTESAFTRLEKIIGHQPQRKKHR